MRKIKTYEAGPDGETKTPIADATTDRLIAALVCLTRGHDEDEMPLWEEESTGEDITIRTAMEDPEMRQRALTTLLEWSRATARNAAMVGVVAIELARRFEVEIGEPTAAKKSRAESTSKPA